MAEQENQLNDKEAAQRQLDEFRKKVEEARAAQETRKTSIQKKVAAGGKIKRKPQQ